ncbi:unnamed protein product [Durusdinium trenchii]|uniref:Uncharacterized protein n=1 Tax=Durusdinium trenchii TaxID=1381693 RepID=A0ABP0I044_9DINO
MSRSRKLTRGAQELLQLASPRSSSSGSDDELDCHIRAIDPAEPDVYLDAFWGPLYFKMERVHKEGSSHPRCSDYLLVSVFLFLNLFVQLAIALQLDDVARESTRDLGHHLLKSACWRVSDHQDLQGVLYPSDMDVSDASHFDFDCVPPIMTLSMFPEMLDLNRDGFWSTEECEQLESQLQGLGSDMAQNMSDILGRMVLFDQVHRMGSSSSNGSLELEFFRAFRGRLQACLTVDPNLCGNLEARGHLLHLFPSLRTGHDRVDGCKANFDAFCAKIFGGDFNWIHFQTVRLCGDALSYRENGVNVVQYGRVRQYEGKRDSILGRTFASFVVLLSFVWIMLMLREFRDIYNFTYVVWSLPSTGNADPHFASFENEKFQILELPMGHKIFALLGILLPRFLIACVIASVGTRFLASTDNLHDIIVNSTALGFIIEVDNMIHTALLGDGFQKHVMDRSERIQVNSEPRGHNEPYSALLVALLVTVGYTLYAYYNPQGLEAIGQGLECLCQLEGNCFSRQLLS